MAIEIVVNNDGKPITTADGTVISNLVPFAKPKKKRAKQKKKLTPKQLFARDVAEMGEVTDHLHAACQNMTNHELADFRSRMQLVLWALRNLKEDTADFVVEEDTVDE